jgi:hypothetical protein
LLTEFARINEPQKNQAFNFINVTPLAQKTEEIEVNRAIAIADREAWEKLAMQEADRLVLLLKQDLPTAVVERYGKANGHYDSPTIMIRRNAQTSTHHSSCVIFSVVVVKESIQQSHSCVYDKGVSLAYSFGGYKENRYNSMEEFVEKSGIAERIRTHVL